MAEKFSLESQKKPLAVKLEINRYQEQVVTIQVPQSLGTPDELTIVGPIKDKDRIARLDGLEAWTGRPIESFVRKFDGHLADIAFGAEPKLEPGLLLISYLPGSYGNALVNHWSKFANPGTSEFRYWLGQKQQALRMRGK